MTENTCLSRMESRSLRCRLTAFLVILAMIFTMFPVQAQAADVKITPTSLTMCKGESAAIKVKGSYKKVRWSSSKSAVVSVSKKGVVKAKKYGTATVYAHVTLKNNKTVMRACDIHVRKLDKIVEAADVTESVVSEAAGCLESGTAFYIRVKGKKQALLDTYAELQKKVAKFNEYGVIFQSDDIFSYKDSWMIFISKTECDFYAKTLSFVRKLVAQERQSVDDGIQDGYHAKYDRMLTREERLELIKSCPTWESYVSAIDDSSKEFEEVAPDIVRRERYNHRLDWFLFNFKFCDLSQVVQAAIIDRSQFFDCNSYYTKELYDNERLFMVYDSEERNASMQAMEANTASGICTDFAFCEWLLFDELGIKAECENGNNHAWTMIYPVNSDGKQLCYKFDYSMYGEEGLIYYMDSQSTIASGYCSNEKIQGTIDDIY